MISTDIIKKRVLIVGSNGMLGQRLAEFYSTKENIELMCSSNEDKSFVTDTQYTQIDITKKNCVKDLILGFVPDIVINAAAYTNVDKSEADRELAWKVNVNGADNLALYSWTIDAHLIHLSTDYIFDGKNGPYSEKDKPNPIGYYGRTKLASENSIIASGVRYALIRTNILYGPAKYGRPDFVKWVVASLKARKEIMIVTDQINNPTYVDDLIYGIDIISKRKKEGIYNLGGKELLSRFEFTIQIADFFKLDKNLIKPILTRELNQPAARPLNSGLINLKAEVELEYKPRTIEESLMLMKSELNL
ncbi:MAG: dTDP-4-dehydrorhamnose reductase [Ignavibacteria bacterium]|nr:MAG: dTDP-4-dehydrorhamnose reductase [Ignavibacteria bacterium]KAF0160451.1 MAG: dTDP-4-dehydrorhamnose reductase [Ignavibacteria bacterium]